MRVTFAILLHYIKPDLGKSHQVLSMTLVKTSMRQSFLMEKILKKKIRLEDTIIPDYLKDFSFSNNLAPSSLSQAIWIVKGIDSPKLIIAIFIINFVVQDVFFMLFFTV
ncbi:hypothetical protein BpHYR1_007766 [Brachionus plicatilis]|uniref:Uncharacterized protein n=1 Tax=Brachionus plicatilis TaxID=10195 RepID=A0A3M7R027_BRAPC|nr:hypothetical protein BpHYR1_007766 [Brachionus plicatilis]